MADAKNKAADRGPDSNEGAELRPMNSAGEVRAGVRDAQFPDEKPSENTVAQIEELEQL